MAEKIYVGQGKKVGKYGNISFSICLDDCEPYATIAKNGKRYVNLIQSEMKQANQWGKTYSYAIDTWKPDPNYKKREPQAQSEPTTLEPEQLLDEDIKVDDIPF